MKYLLSSCFLIVFHFVSIGQYFTIDTVKDISPHAYHSKYIFPNLKCKADQVAADRINRDLRQDILEVDSGEQLNSIFEKVWGGKENPMPSAGDFSFEVINNNARFFCISVSAQGCGAYCEDWTRYYMWDSRSGRKIELQELFSPTGMIRLSDSLRTLRVHRIKSAVSDLKKAWKKDLVANPDNAEGMKVAMDIFNDCMDTTKTPSVQFSYTMDDEQLNIYLGACLPHVIRAYDEMDYKFRFDLQNWELYLSDYAKSLLKP